MLLAPLRRATAFVAVVPHILLKPADEPHQLLSLNLFGVKVVGFGYVKVRDNLLGRLGGKHVLVDRNIVVVLVVLTLFKVVNYRHLGRVVFEHELGRHRGHETARERQSREVNVFLSRLDDSCHFEIKLIILFLRTKAIIQI